MQGDMQDCRSRVEEAGMQIQGFWCRGALNWVAYTMYRVAGVVYLETFC